MTCEQHRKIGTQNNSIQKTERAFKYFLKHLLNTPDNTEYRIPRIYKQLNATDIDWVPLSKYDNLFALLTSIISEEDTYYPNEFYKTQKNTKKNQITIFNIEKEEDKECLLDEWDEEKKSTYNLEEWKKEQQNRKNELHISFMEDIQNGTYTEKNINDILKKIEELVPIKNKAKYFIKNTFNKTEGKNEEKNGKNDKNNESDNEKKWKNKIYEKLWEIHEEITEKNPFSQKNIKKFKENIITKEKASKYDDALQNYIPHFVFTYRINEGGKIEIDFDTSKISNADLLIALVKNSYWKIGRDGTNDSIGKAPAGETPKEKVKRLNDGIFYPEDKLDSSKEHEFILKEITKELEKRLSESIIPEEFIEIAETETEGRIKSLIMKLKKKKKV